MRKALELSITTAPAAAATGAHCFETEPPAEASTTSTPLKASALTGSIVSVWPFHSTVCPAERGEASKVSRPTGNWRSANSSSSS